MDPVRILLVEDDPDHQLLLRDTLCANHPEARVVVVGSGSAALRCTEESDSAFDCILMDYNLPDYTADELLPQIAKLCGSCPVLVCSSSREQRVVIQSLRNGSVDFIPKTDAIQGNKLWSRISCALNRARRRSERRRKVLRRVGHLARLAEEDPLTGLANRRRVERLFRGRRQLHDRRRLTAAIMVDIDHFKQVNDTYGHDCGDRVLSLVGSKIRQHAATDDVTCRYGGEEFLILKHDDSLATTLDWAERLRGAIAAQSLDSDCDELAVTVSVGLTAGHRDQEGQELVIQADQALYLAKRCGRNRVCTWDRVLFERAADYAPGECQDPIGRLQHVLSELDSALGPTQRNHLTAHAAFVSDMSVRLGWALGLDAGVVDQLRIAGLLHDIGKFLIPEALLAKAAPLTDAERSMLSRHASDGAELAAVLGAENAACTMIRGHHTPYHVAANEHDAAIATGTSILTVADAFVAMTSPRPYQPSRSCSSAAAELRRCRKVQFDPKVVNALPHALLAGAAPHIFSDRMFTGSKAANAVSIA